jgi:predicted Zn-dependent protease
MLQSGGKVLTTDQWTREVLPARPEMAQKAAWLLYPEPELADARRPFLEVALQHFQNRPDGLKAKDYYVRGQIQDALDRPNEALESYRLALSRDRQQTAWRLEMARLLLRQKQYKEAEDALRIVLHDQPANEEVLDLLRAAHQGTKDKK